MDYLDYAFLIGLVAPLLLSLVIYALFGKSLRRRRRRQMKKFLESED